MVETDTWFLLVQYKRAGRTTVTTFRDPQVAAAAYSEAERKHKDQVHGTAREVRKLLATLPPVPAL